MAREVEIRRYRRRDRRAVLEIAERNFAGACMESRMEEHFGKIADTTWQQRKRNGMDYDLRNNADHVLVAQDDGKVVGFVCNRVYPNISTGHIANLAVEAEYQGRGIGKMLVRASLDHFRRIGLKYARVETLEQNEKGRKLYPAFGFREVGRQIYFLREL